jgi:hypothetical protein
MDQRVKLRRSWLDGAQLWVVVAGGGMAVVATVAKLLGANWPWAATAGVVVGGAAVLLGQVVS